MAFLRQLPAIRTAEARFGVESAVKEVFLHEKCAEKWNSLLLILVYLGHNYKAGTGETSAYPPPPFLDVSSLHVFPS